MKGYYSKICFSDMCFLSYSLQIPFREYTSNILQHSPNYGIVIHPDLNISDFFCPFIKGLFNKIHSYTF